MSFWQVAAKAAIGAENARPVSTAAGSARSVRGDWATPNAAMHAEVDGRDERQPDRDPGRSFPSSTSVTDSGVASMAK